MKFTKMEGLGNDYIYINCLKETVHEPEKLAIAMSDRHFGIGSDGLVLIMESDCADFRMRMFNADGSEGKMCGNAARCIGKYVYDLGLTKKTLVSLSTLGGIRYLDLHINDGLVDTVNVDMGEPVFLPSQIPMISEKNPVIGEIITLKDKEFAFTCLSMGNPHAVTFVEDTEVFDVSTYGSILELHYIFPEKVNTEFVQVIDRNKLKMRVWERGSGETLACGTGACATLVAGVLNNYCDRDVDIVLLGGTIHIRWDEKDNHIYMEGPARFCFHGEWLK